MPRPGPAECRMPSLASGCLAFSYCSMIQRTLSNPEQAHDAARWMELQLELADASLCLSAANGSVAERRDRCIATGSGSGHAELGVDHWANDAIRARNANSAEHMRQVAQYKIGVIVGYNASPPVKGRGSCIFLHIWTGPDSHTAGCTAFDEAKLREVMLWLDPVKRPLLVQLTGQEYQKLQA